jgi:hypothetical protein
MMPESSANQQNSRILPGENPDLEGEIKEVLGTEWLYQRNVRLGGEIPAELLRTPNEYKVRNILRSIMASALS